MFQNWKLWWCILIPIIFSPLVVYGLDNNPKLKCLYVIILMALFWMVEALPIAITSLLPVPLFPLLGLLSTSQVVSNYMKESGMMFIGGISLALGIEHCGIHKRIALNTLLLLGTSLWRLLLGILFITFFLSCWIVNTSAAAMMIPIVSGLIDAFDSTTQINRTKDDENDGEKRKKKLHVLFFLAVGYGANIGGTAVIMGSNPNLIFRDLATLQNIGQNGKYTDINFGTWAAFHAPIALINLFITWVVLGWIHLRKGKSKTQFSSVEDETSQEIVKGNLSTELKSLGPMSFHEKAVATLFGITITLWLFRDPQVFPGWMKGLFPNGGVVIGDSSVAVLMVIFMFALPKDPKALWPSWKKDDQEEAKISTETLMTWTILVSKFPWGVVLLLGGGFAIANGAEVSGLSDWVGEQLESLQSLPHPLILFIILLVLSILTEFTSNAGTVSLITPILFSLSKRLNLHPLYLSLAGVGVAQYAFVLPTSNPPNAVVFGAGGMKMMDMILPGVILNMCCLLTLFVMNLTWGQFLFQWNHYEYPVSLFNETAKFF